MQHRLSQSFVFEAAHSLQREFDRDASLRIHGHSYRATIFIAGSPETSNGMLTDLCFVKQQLEQVRQQLDHRLLDDVPNLGPATLENLCSYIWHQLLPSLPQLQCVRVAREMTGDACELLLDKA